MKNKIQNQYPSETVGRRTISNVPVCESQDKVSEIKNDIFQKAQDLETLNYIYVLKEGKLIGVFSLKEIFRRKENEEANDFMNTKIIKINPYTDQEKVAFLAIKHNLKAIPVVDENDYFLGIIPSDVILDILHKEHIEDIFLSAGLHKKNLSLETLEAPIGILAKVRLPWLITGLLGGILAAKITIIFEGPLKSHFILAAFIPLIVYMADAVGSQTQALYIRNLAINHFSQRKYFLKEIKIGFLMAVILSVLLFLVSLIIAGEFLIGIILGISLFLTIIAAIFISVSIVYGLVKIGRDPALGSGPFATIIADISSLMIYFLVATLLLSVF